MYMYMYMYMYGCHNNITVQPEIWQRIKFSSLAVYIATIKLKSTKISYTYNNPVPNHQI